MSLTVSRLFTISTYDPPSTPIALTAQQFGKKQAEETLPPEGELSGKKSSPAGSGDVWGNLRRTEATPPVRSKILPWVQDILTEGYVPPEGMFGPYDSRAPVFTGTGSRLTAGPPTRHQSPQQTAPSGLHRNVHPFAFDVGQSVPLSTMTSEVNMETAMAETIADRQRPTSDMLSRGAGNTLRLEYRGNEAHPYLHLGPIAGPKGISSAHGPSQDPDSSSEILLPQVPMKTPAKSSHGPARQSSALETPMPEEELNFDEPETHDGLNAGANVKIRHEFPFSREESLRREVEAMAQFEALQKLIGAATGPRIPADGMFKGPRNTYETATSGPSFGHIHHRDGAPATRHASFQAENYGDPGSFGRAVFHIPFGGNVGIRLPRAPAAPGGLSVDDHVLQAEPEDKEPRHRRSDRSAFVESVTDEQDPTVKPVRSGYASQPDFVIDCDEPHRKSRLNSDKSIESQVADVSRMGIHKDEELWTKKSQANQPPVGSTEKYHRSPPDRKKAKAGNSSGRLPDQPTMPEISGRDMSQGNIENNLFVAMEPIYSADIARQIAMTHSGRGPPFPAELHSPAILHPPMPGIPSMTSQMPTQGSLTPALHERQSGLRMPSTTSNLTVRGSPESQPRELEQEQMLSPAFTSVSTTPSNVKHIVAESKFHDETLCQLLDAARLNLIGEEAKRALNRAARARVIELRDMRANGEIGGEGRIPLPRTPPRTPPRKDRKEKRPQSKDRKSRKASNPSDMPPLPDQNRSVDKEDTRRKAAEKVEPNNPPEWAQEILNRLSMFDARLSQMDHDSDRLLDHRRVPGPSQDIPSEFLNDLIFNADMSAGAMASGGIPGLPIPLEFDPFSLAFGGPASQSFAPVGGAYLRNLSSDEKDSGGSRSRDATGAVMSWGSEVELPADDAKFSPPSKSRSDHLPDKGQNAPPTINIQPPTESYLGKSLRNASGSQAGTVRTAQSTRSPGESQNQRYTVDADKHAQAPSPRYTDTSVLHPAMPDPTERDLPPPPSESIRSHRPSSSATVTPVASPVHRRRGETPISLREALGQSDPFVSPRRISKVPSAEPTVVNYARVSVPKPAKPPASESARTVYKTARQSLSAGTPPPGQKGKTTVVDSAATVTESNPWDLVMHKLYGWAVVWEERSFSHAMEEISLGKQVGEFALTIFMMMTFKRMLRRSLTETPRRTCDKLFVPPTFAEAINQAVHAQQYKAAQQMLEELWYPFLFKDPPRVIIALTRDPKNHDTWLAHRFDLGSAHLRSYKFCSEESEVDGRPFRWWYAIRLAWPQFKIPDPDALMIQTTSTFSPPEQKQQNSLAALNCARNLFLGFRPEHAADLSKLRESVWGEVKRLRERKRGGKLVIDMDVPSKDTVK